MPSDANVSSNQDSNVVETIQSLIVAFVLAMTFRGFVTEGFVIPTGSMAPTLLGQHALIHSEMTGYEFPVGLDQFERGAPSANLIPDPMLGPQYPGSGVPQVTRPRGMGDRILVIKSLYPFSEPHRFDVVVFKNPTDPIGDASNYIKRLIGLPNEQIWLADGDVFARPLTPGSNPELPGEAARGFADFKIQRKPIHAQQAVWQTIYNSDFAPAPKQAEKLNRPYPGPPWVGDPSAWKIDGRSYTCIRSEPSILTWDNGRRAVNDWLIYNALSDQPPLIPVSDIRVSAAIVAQQAGLKTTFELQARSHIFQFIIDNSAGNRNATATLRMRPLTSPDVAESWVSRSASVTLPAPGNVFDVEFWHADQAMRLFINGTQVITLEYDWSPLQRLQFATGDFDNDNIESLLTQAIQVPQIRWRFEGSPVTLHRVRLDRDLYYRTEMLNPSHHQRNAPKIFGHGFGIDPTEMLRVGPNENDVIANGVLGPDQFMMCGDNSQKSLDSRLWGSPHPLIATQIDDHPFTVNRKLLLGKAWVVYFPAPYPLTENGFGVIPDFGRLRFIR